MAKNDFLARMKQAETERLYIVQTWTAQLMVDLFMDTLNDPDVMGKDVFGAGRLDKICKAVMAQFDKYCRAIQKDPEADYIREKIDRRQKQIFKEKFLPWKDRYFGWTEDTYKGRKRKLRGVIAMQAKSFLQRLRKLDCMIENKMVERRQWHELALGLTAGSAPETGVRVQSAGSQQRMADAIDKCVDIDAEINACIDKLYDAKREVIKVIEQLNASEYDLLHKVYVQYMDFNDVAYAMGRSKSWVTTVHGRALRHVQDILDGGKSED